jgi:restriction endonuclease S subunit
MTVLDSCKNIFFGYNCRSAEELVDNGEFVFLQPKDINQEKNTFNSDEAAKMNKFNAAKKYLLIKGDVLIQCKGRNTPVIMFDGSLSNVIASSAFVIIRTNEAHLNPYFLAWYLEQKEAQNYLFSRKAGTTVLNLPIKAIQDLQIPLLSMDIQKIYGELYIKRNRLKHVQFDILKKECQLIDMSLLKILKKRINDDF